MKGLLYVVYNEWIINPKTGKMPCKIGITTKTVVHANVAATQFV
jgi:hypothetical protein